MTYKYSKKEIVNELKELGLYHDRLEEYILAKSTKPKSTGKEPGGCGGNPDYLPKSTGKDGKRGKGQVPHCSPSTVNSRPKPNKIENTNFWKGHTESQLNQMWEKQCEIIQVINYLLEKER